MHPCPPQMDFDLGEINLDDDWDAEIPGGVEEGFDTPGVLFEQALVVEAVKEDEAQRVEFIEDWRDDLAMLLEGPDMLVVDEWKGYDEQSSSLTVPTRQLNKCPACGDCPVVGVMRHIICHHLPWFAYP